MPRAEADDDVHRNLQFGPFELSSRERVLRRDGVVLPLGSRALDILIYLAERLGKVIAKAGADRSRLVGRNRRGGEHPGPRGRDPQGAW
jgi:hypothetical protein